MLTDDENIIDIQFAVQYNLKNAADYRLQRAQARRHRGAGRADRDQRSRRPQPDGLRRSTKGAPQIATETEKLMQAMLDRYGTGIYVQKVTLQNTQPPEQVQAAFDDAVKASQDRERQKNEGQAYANDVVPRARGMASRLLQEADGYNASVVQRAEGDASRFRQILVEYARRRPSRAQRLYLDMMQSVLGNSSKVLIDQKNGNNLLYLPLDQLLKTGAGGEPPVPLRRRCPRRAPSRRQSCTLDAGRSRELPRKPRPGVDDESRHADCSRCWSRPCWCCRSRSTRSTRSSTRSSSSSANSSMPRPRRACTSRCRCCRTSSSTTPHPDCSTTPEPDRITTSEKKPLKVDFIAYWRIIDVRKYYQSVTGDEEAAKTSPRADDTRQSRRRRSTSAPCTKRSRPSANKIMTTTRQKADADAKTIGVEVVDVRLRRVELPDEVLAQVYQRMESERKRVANELRSQGGAESEKIRADADRQREVILADAYKQAQKTKGEGDAKASAIYAAAYGQNPEFYSFYRSLEAYKATFKNKSDVMVLDPSSEFFQYLKQPGGVPRLRRPRAGNVHLSSGTRGAGRVCWRHAPWCSCSRACCRWSRRALWRDSVSPPDRALRRTAALHRPDRDRHRCADLVRCAVT